MNQSFINNKTKIINMKKSLMILCLVIISFNTHSMPKTTIEKVYFATSAKQIVVGYYYQGCTASAHVSWGIRTNYSFSNDGLPPVDCTGLGDIGGGEAGSCVLSYIFDGNYNTYNELYYSLFKDIVSQCVTS